MVAENRELQSRVSPLVPPLSPLASPPGTQLVMTFGHHDISWKLLIVFQTLSMDWLTVMD